MADFFDEIKEDLKRERFEKVLKDYGGYFAAILLAIVCGTASVSWYGSYVENTNEQNSSKYGSAIKLISSDTEKAKEIFAEIYDDNSFGINKFAGMRLAALTAKDDPKKGLEIYDTIITDSSTDIAIRELAALHAVKLISENKNGVLADKSDNLDSRLDVISNETDPWLFSAMELKAINYLNAGNEEEAIRIFNQLKNADETPDYIRSRAGKIIKILGNKKS